MLFQPSESQLITAGTACAIPSKADGIRASLAHFTGSEEHHRFGLRSNVLATDGAKEMAELCVAYWLLDAISSHQSARVDAACQGFQVWTLKLAPTKSEPRRAVLECRADSDAEPVVRQVIPYTDFPLPEGITLYTEGDRSLQVILLPSEH